MGAVIHTNCPFNYSIATIKALENKNNMKIRTAVRGRKPPTKTALPPGEYKKYYNHTFVFANKI